MGVETRAWYASQLMLWHVTVTIIF